MEHRRHREYGAEEVTKQVNRDRLVLGTVESDEKVENIRRMKRQAEIEAELQREQALIAV